jgi:two-component system LytT family response regulator
MRVLLVDDEPPARRKLRRLLAPHVDVEIVGEAGSGEEAVRALQEVEADVVFLDVQLPDIDGFEVLRRVAGPARFRPVFVTAYDTFAVRAFEVRALDYLLKPVDPRRFDAMLARAREATSPERGPRHLERLLVTDGDRSYYVAAATIDWLEARRNYVVLHEGGREHLVRGTLEAFVLALDPARVTRISRSHVVSKDSVRELMTWTHGERQVVMRDGVTLTWTRRYKPRS